MNHSHTDHLHHFVSYWGHNISITILVACGLPRLILSYGLFSHHCIPQERECARCAPPKWQLQSESICPASVSEQSVGDAEARAELKSN